MDFNPFLLAHWDAIASLSLRTLSSCAQTAWTLVSKRNALSCFQEESLNVAISRGRGLSSSAACSLLSLPFTAPDIPSWPSRG